MPGWKAIRAMASFGVTCAIVLGPSADAPAGDGMIEINQAIAERGAVNGDLTKDPPGFPVVITEPGSYILTGNLSLMTASFAGIQIDSNDVHIDLNGFRIELTGSGTIMETRFRYSSYSSPNSEASLGSSALFRYTGTSAEKSRRTTNPLMVPR